MQQIILILAILLIVTVEINAGPLRSPRDATIANVAVFANPYTVIRSQLIGSTNFVWWVTTPTNRTISTVNFTNAPTLPATNLVIQWVSTGSLLVSTNLTNWVPQNMPIAATVRVPNNSQRMFFRVPANVGISSNSVTLGWTASASPVSGYVVYYGPSSGLYQNSIMVPDVQETRIAGLNPGATYYFAVTAVDGVGVESAKSNEVAYQIPTQSFVQQPQITQ